VLDRCLSQQVPDIRKVAFERKRVSARARNLLVAEMGRRGSRVRREAVGFARDQVEPRRLALACLALLNVVAHAEIISF
jgi:hypothetical protein